MSDGWVEVLTAAAEASPETAAVGGVAYTFNKILGPTVNAIGTTLGDFTDYRMRNWLGIGARAQRRLEEEPDGEDESLTVHPRVAQAVLLEGSWIDDDIHQEYLAGLLVGARSKDGASDAAAYLARIVTTLTAAQVRLHYAIYRAYAGYWIDDGRECPVPWNDSNRYAEHAVVADSSRLITDFPGMPWMGLNREGLISDHGNPPGDESISRFAFVPSHLGADVFLHALGHPEAGPQVLCLSDQRRNELLAEGSRVVRLTLPEPAPVALQNVTIEAL